MMARLRAGLIGCGFYASNHLNAWRELKEEVQLAAVCDLEPEKARAAAEVFGAPSWYTDATVMMDETRLDFVDIVTTMPAHKPLVLLAACHRLPAIVQKPSPPPGRSALPWWRRARRLA
jgi:predicted dehydrogenase